MKLTNLLQPVTSAIVNDDDATDNTGNSNNNDSDDGDYANGNSRVIEQDPNEEAATDMPREILSMTHLPRRVSETPAAVTAAGMTSTYFSRQSAQAKATGNVR
jgi:hypothetical protein